MSERKTPQTAAEAVATMSHSKTEMWHRCQFQWFNRYVLGTRRPPSAFMALGRATDATADFFYKAKMDRGVDLEEGDTLDFWHSEFDEEAKKVDTWDDGGQKGKLSDQGSPAVASWRERIATQVMPTKLKVWFELIMEGDWLLNGEIDLVHRPMKEQHRLPIAADTKMSSKRWSARQAFATLQPAIYSLALDNAPDVEANTSLFQFHVGILYNPATKRKSTNPSQLISRRVTENEKDGALARVAMTRRQIMVAFETGDFLPNRLATTCSRRHCAFWSECEARFGPRVPD